MFGQLLREKESEWERNCVVKLVELADSREQDKDKTSCTESR
jgi:hypothetical protein